MKKIKQIIAIVLSMLTISLFTMAPALAATSCSDAGLTAREALACGSSNGASATPDASSSTTISTTLGTVLNVLSAATAVISVIMIVIGGLRYVTSGGNQDAVSGAKKTILYALIGLVIVALAQVMVQFVLKKTT